MARIERRPRGQRTLAGLVALIALLLVSAPAVADPPAARAFNFTGTEQRYVVPASVGLIDVLALGGDGGQAPTGDSFRSSTAAAHGSAKIAAPK